MNMALRNVYTKDIGASSGLVALIMSRHHDDESGFIPLRSGSFSVLDTRVPVAGQDYPADLDELARMFPSERACCEHLERLRWPRGFLCPSCGDTADPWRSGTGLVACRACRHPANVAHGTLFQGSTVPLVRWYRALWEIAQRENGVTADVAGQLLGLRSAADGAQQLHRIRRAMAQASPEPLRREVRVATARLELDSMAPGGWRDRVVVALAAECRGGDRARVAVRRLRIVSPLEVVRFVMETTEPGARVYTTPWRGFGAIGRAGFEHRVQPTAVGDGPDPQQVSSLLGLWLWSTPEIEVDGLQEHLDDFVFRFNRRYYPPGLLFYRLLILATRSEADPLRAVSARLA
jgi:transposase-like zinc ribbon protein